jgi:hypothetical protein
MNFKKNGFTNVRIGKGATVSENPPKSGENVHALLTRPTILEARRRASIPSVFTSYLPTLFYFTDMDSEDLEHEIIQLQQLTM